MKRKNGLRRRLVVERVERRDLFAGMLVQEFLPEQVYEQAHQDAVMAEIGAYSTGGNAKLNALIFLAQPGTHFGRIEDFDLRADMLPRGRPDGVYETVLQQNIRPVTNHVLRFHSINLGVNVQGVPLQITADIRSNASPGEIGLGRAIGSMSSTTFWPWWNVPTPTYTVGADNPRHDVEAAVSLIVTEKFGPSVDVAVSNQNNVPFGRFTATAENDDLLVTSVTYAAQEGNVVNAHSWTLWADTDFNGSVDTIVEDNVQSTGGNVVFDDLFGGGFVVEVGRSVLFEVRADIASSLSGDRLRMGIVDVEGERLNTGASLTTSQIDVFPASQTLWHLERNGQLIVVPDSVPVPFRDLLAGGAPEVILRVELQSNFEQSAPNYIGIDITGDSSSIDRLELFRPGETVAFAIASRVGALLGDTFGAHLNSRQLLVSKGGQQDVLVMARIKPDTAGGGPSGSLFSAAVDRVMAIGDFSSRIYDGQFAVGPVASLVHRVVLSKITSITNANPDTNGTNVPTGVTPFFQMKMTGAFNVNTNNAPNRSLLRQVPVEVDATNVAMDAAGFVLYNKADSSWVSRNYRLERLDGSLLPNTGTVTGMFRVVFFDLANSGVNTEIENGSYQTFVVGGNITNSKVNPLLISRLRGSLRPAICPRIASCAFSLAISSFSRPRAAST